MIVQFSAAPFAVRDSNAPCAPRRSRGTVRTPRRKSPRRLTLVFEVDDVLVALPACGLLRALWNLRLRGGREDVPVAQQALYHEVLAEPNPERQLGLNSRDLREGKLRIAALAEVIRSAAPLDPDIADLWTRINTEYHANQRAIVEASSTKRRSNPTSTSNARLTSSGRSTIPTPGSCSSHNAAGHRSNTSGGLSKPPSINS